MQDSNEKINGGKEDLNPQGQISTRDIRNSRIHDIHQKVRAEVSCLVAEMGYSEAGFVIQIIKKYDLSGEIIQLNDDDVSIIHPHFFQFFIYESFDNNIRVHGDLEKYYDASFLDLPVQEFPHILSVITSSEEIKFELNTISFRPAFGDYALALCEYVEVSSNKKRKIYIVNT
jgi:hypothetical protein